MRKFIVTLDTTGAERGRTVVDVLAAIPGVRVEASFTPNRALAALTRAAEKELREHHKNLRLVRDAVMDLAR